MNLIESVCLCGAGFMGWQIGLLCASHGFSVNIFDISKEALAKASGSILEELGKRVESGSINNEMAEMVFSRIQFFDEMRTAVKNVDLVIEAVPERLDIKKQVFANLDKLCDKDAILASNSSSIRISKIEGATDRIDRVLNTHFYNIPWSRSIVELMKGTATSEETMNRVKEFMYSIGITPLTVLKESTGFIFNRVWRAIKRECLHLVDQGVALFEDVDRAWMTINKTPMGPFGMMDRVGLDVVRDIEMVYYNESGDKKDAPPNLLREKVEKGELGVKTGKGFYTYPNPKFQDPNWLTGKTLSS